MGIERCAGCEVRDRALCTSLADDELARLNAISRQKQVERGATLLWAGDEGVVCGNVISGILQMTATAADGREQIVGLLYPGDFLGQPQPGQTPFSVVALTDCQLCVFPRADFQVMLDEHVAMAALLLRRTMTALDEARQRMLMLSRATAAEKLAGFLLDMAARTAGGDGSGTVSLELPLSRGQIADVLGLTIETVSRQMTHFRTAGLIALPGGRSVTILDRAGLRRHAMAG